MFSGQPYPELDDGVRLTKVPSLDLYREPDPFRTPRPSEIRDLIDVLEVATMWTAGFPEPLTFSRRVARLLARRTADFDVVHDNQTLGYGMLDVERAGLPLVTTIHHPITFDRRVELAAAQVAAAAADAAPVVRLPAHAGQGRPAAAPDPHRLGELPARHRHRLRRGPRAAPGDPARRRRRVRPAGAAAGARPDRRDGQRRHPDQGGRHLLEAFAKLRTERDVELLLITRPKPGGRTERLIEELAIGDAVRFVHGISDEELAATVGSAEVACVPSLYEGFSLPTVEAMACETPLVVSRAGALPEVVGPDGVCADLVTPGDVGELVTALEALLDDPERRARMGRAGRERVLEHFTWRAVAEATAAAYQDAIDDHARRTTAGE